MSLKNLIDNQTIMIDDHLRGTREKKNWDDKNRDIHIDKKTNRKVEGKRQDIQIRVPINSDRPIKIENNKGRLNEIPRQINREIRSAFENKETREAFISDVIDTLENFPTILENEKRVQNVLEKLSKHFDLDWSGEVISTYAKDALKYYAQLYFDKYGKQYFITVDNEKIEIGQNNGYARYFKKLPRK